MTVEHRKKNYTGTRIVKITSSIDTVISVERFSKAHDVPEGLLEQAAYWTAHSNAMQSRVENYRLKSALIEHIWERSENLDVSGAQSDGDIGKELSEWW
jgi:hypothetical protein